MSRSEEMARNVIMERVGEGLDGCYEAYREHYPTDSDRRTFYAVATGVMASAMASALMMSVDDDPEDTIQLGREVCGGVMCALREALSQA